jgi:hypothetical protein
MDSLVYLVIGLIFGALAAYRLANNAVRLYRADRDRRTRLRALERDPKNEDGSPEEIAGRLDAAVAIAMREDLTLTGALLALIGVSGVFVGRGLGYGPMAVGLYTAGLIGIVVGVALALLGGLARAISVPLIRKEEARGDGRS